MEQAQTQDRGDTKSECVFVNPGKVRTTRPARSDFRDALAACLGFVEGCAPTLAAPAVGKVSLDVAWASFEHKCPFESHCAEICAYAACSSCAGDCDYCMLKPALIMTWSSHGQPVVVVHRTFAHSCHP